MIVHPLIKTLAMRPHLLAEHAGAYLALAGAEAAQLAAGARRRMLLLAGAAVCGACGALLAGGALLLAAALPVQDMPAPWALLAIPAVPLAAAGALWWAEQRQALDLNFPLLREQMQLDRELLQRVAQED